MAHEEHLPSKASEPTESARIKLIEDQVRELARLSDKGLLTYEEYASKKAALLSQL